MMNFNDYINDIPYPVKPVRKCIDCGDMFKGKDRFCSQCGNAVFNQHLRKIDEYDIQRKRYYDNEREIIESFKRDVLDEFGLYDLPKTTQDKIFDFAWDKGHSCGLQEVCDWIKELSELFKEIV